MHDIFGDLGQSEEFSSAFAKALGELWADGTEATLARYAG